MRAPIISLVFVVLCPASQAHPGSGIVALSASVALTGDATTNGIWRFESGKAPIRLVDNIHCHWMTKGLNGRLYAESLGESGGAWETSLHALDANGRNPRPIPSGVSAYLGSFVVSKNGGIVYQDKEGRMVVEHAKRVAPFRGARSPMGNVFSMAWGPGEALYVSTLNSVHRIGKDGKLVTLATIRGQVTDPLYVGRDERSRIWGLAVDSAGNAYAALPAEGRVVRIGPDRQVATVYRTEDRWATVGLAAHGKDVFLLESLTVGNSNHGPRVRVLRPGGATDVLGTANGP